MKQVISQMQKTVLSWMRIRLRTLFLATAAVAVCLSFWVGPTRQQKKAVEELNKVHALVVYDYELNPNGSFNKTAKLPGPDWMRQWFGIDCVANVEVVSVGDGFDAFSSAVWQAKFGQTSYMTRFQLSSGVDDQALQFLLPFPHLKRLNLCNTQVSDRGMKFVNQLTELEELDLRKTSVTIAGLAELKDLRDLKVLRVSPSVRNPMPPITDEHAAMFANWPLLHSIDDFEMVVSDDSVRHLKQMTQIKSLTLQFHADLTDRGCRELATMVQLEKLSLAGNRITDQACDAISQLVNLKRLYLGYTQITDVGLSKLCQIQSLHTLTLTSCQITDAGLVHLQVLPQLAVVDLSFTSITDDGAKELLKLPNLRKAFVAGTEVSESLEAKLRYVPAWKNRRASEQ